MSTFNPPVRFTRLLLKVNAFLLVALLLVGAFMGLVAYKQGWFVHHTEIRFLTPNALGINQGMPVKLYGFTVGSVRALDIATNGVEVKLSIMSEHLARIPRGSQARFSREAGVIGASVIDIIPKQGATEALEPGEYIQFEPARGLAEIIDELRKQVVPVFNELKGVLSDIARSKDDVTGSITLLRKEMELLPETHRELRTLLRRADEAVAEVGRQASAVGKQATLTLKAAERASDTAERAAGSVERAVPVLAGKLATSLDSLDAMTGQLRRTGEEAQDTLRRARPILERGETAAREAADVVGAAKRVWPLSDSFRPNGDGMLPIDSFEARPAAVR